MGESATFEYYIRYRKRTHELIKVLDNDDDSDYEVMFRGTYDRCIAEIGKLENRKDKIECACCEQFKDKTELIESDNGELFCKDRIKCNETYYEILNTV